MPRPATGYGWCVLPVLHFLWGRPWDDAAKNCLRSLRPSSVRTSRGEIKSDARCWRVTVYLTEDDRVERIDQEVEVELVGCRFGADVQDYAGYRG